jgi:quercetin dioxygenase-like cupin family protein
MSLTGGRQPTQFLTSRLCKARNMNSSVLMLSPLMPPACEVDVVLAHDSERTETDGKRAAIVRLLITGVDAQGKSAVLRQEDLALDQLAPGFAMGIPYATTTSPPPARASGAAPLIDQGIAPGLTRWMVVELGPGSETPMHHTDTLDLQTVLSGTVDLVLDDGDHRLGQGDLVVLAGVDHAWRAGPDGCLLTAVLIGTPPPDAEGASR